MKDDSKIKGWTQLCSDVNWTDYHGMWAKKARDGSWYVLKWDNVWDSAGEASGLEQYECQVRRVDWRNIAHGELCAALKSCGFELRGMRVVDSNGEELLMPWRELAIVECCISYGHGAPLETFTSNVRPLSVRAKARRYAEECMRDAAKLAARLSRPVNAIGSTAEEYGSGRVLEALGRGPFDTTKQIMRKLHGLVPAEESLSEDT